MSRVRIVGITGVACGLMAGLALGASSLAAASSPATGSQAKSHSGHHGHHHSPGLLVTKVDGQTITLDTPRGVKTVTVDAQTKYTRGHEKATLADVKPGEIVHVRLAEPKNASSHVLEVRISPAHLAGYVTAVEGSTLTVVDESGFTRSVQESSATSYRDAGKSATSSSVSVGKFIRVLGNVDANTTTLDATRIAVGVPAQGRHPKKAEKSGPDQAQN